MLKQEWISKKVKPPVPTIPDIRAEITPDQIGAHNVHDIEHQLTVLEPMTKETDLLLRTYFYYVNHELSKISSLVQFPLSIYDGEAQSMAEVKSIYQRLVSICRALVEARGRKSTGQIGTWFWASSEVKDLETAFAEMGVMIAKAGAFLDKIN